MRQNMVTLPNLENPMGKCRVVGHGDEQHEDGHAQCDHHGVVYILPLVVVGKPGCEPGAYLAENHEEEVDDGHAGGLFLVQLVPSGFVGRLIARCQVVGGFDAEAILDEGEEVTHEQGLAHEAHHQAAQGQHIHALGAGADEAQQHEDGKAYHEHHLLAAQTHQAVEERREGRHAHRGGKAHKGDVLGDDAQSAYHLGAVGRVDAAHRHDGDEQQNQEDDAQRLRHPVVEGEVLGELFGCHP